MLSSSQHDLFSCRLLSQGSSPTYFTCVMQYLISGHVEFSKSSFVDLLHALLKFDPSERLSARQALDHPFFKDPT